VLFPQLASVRVERLSATDRVIRLDAAACAGAVACPVCGQLSDRVHSRYERRLAECGVGGREVVIRLEVRRFRYSTVDCPRRIFAEPAAGLAGRYQRRSTTLATLLGEVALALGGRAGARMADLLAVPVSRSTLLRLIGALPLPEFGDLREVGVDDFALRRGHVYGTVVVDMVTGRPVDLLADRCADTVADWLAKHPGIAVVCRDRGGPYADGATRGAPQAIQVADRWHLLDNLADAVEKVIRRDRAALREPAADAPAPPAPALPSPAAATAAPQEGRRAANTRARHAQIHALAADDLTQTAICQTLNLDPKTVRKYLHTTDPEHLLTPTPAGRGPLTAHKSYLNRRFAEGCTNAVRLWEEICARGYRGSRRSVRRHLATLRTPAARPPRPTELKVRQVRAWIMRRPHELADSDRERLDALLARSPILAAATELAHAFADMLRRRQGHDLLDWVKTAEDSDIPELATFATGLRADFDAVTAGLTLPHNSGPVEGHVNRIKMIKRTMYGRAGLDLLRRRVLLAS